MSKLKIYIDDHGIRITWLSKVTGIQYDKLYRYVKYGLVYASKEDQDLIIKALGVDLKTVM